ncbi:hypothetical protein GCM10022291_31920 [Postechiella marina]|uniref:Secretion system C-terminal sorting domain-containing protein n=1 Tax=Postechiella marina TaxID=943941 RepID=A0ABP8CGM9_9FLAO
MFKNLIVLLFIFTHYSSVFSLQSQNTPINKVKRHVYKDGIVSMEKWFGNDKQIDSIKTYYTTGELDEVFYILNGTTHGKCYKFNSKGKKVTTWEYNKGKLEKRTDHIKEYNKKDEEKIKELHTKLNALNNDLRQNPKNSGSFAKRAYIRYMLNNKILTLQDQSQLEKKILTIQKVMKGKNLGKPLGNIYDVKGAIYSSFEMENYATHYRFKATEADPENARLHFNLGAYLFKIKSYRLAKIYLNKALEKWPKHAFTHRVLAAMHSDFEDYEKAKYHIDIAFPKEEHLLKHGSGKVERDIRVLKGFISHKLGESDSAIDDLKEAINLNKENSFAYRNLGVVYHDIGNHKLACKYLQKAKALGYEKKHDRNDLQAYLDISCNTPETVISSKSEAKKEIITNTNPLNKPYVFPNPTVNIVSVKNIPFKNYEYSIYNFQAKLIRTSQALNNSINLQDLPTGLYILKIKNKDTVHSFKVVKK